MTNPKCKCTMSISVLGDGCRYCQPQECIDRMIADSDEMGLNNELYVKAFELIVHKTNHVAYSSDEASMMIYETCEIAKGSLKL